MCHERLRHFDMLPQPTLHLPPPPPPLMMTSSTAPIAPAHAAATLTDEDGVEDQDDTEEEVDVVLDVVKDVVLDVDVTSRTHL